METITINNVDYEIYTNEQGIYLEFYSDDAEYTKPHLAPNGCKKRVKFIELSLKEGWKIKTTASVHDLSPTGVELNTCYILNYDSSQEDIDLFKSQGEILINSAVINGLARYILGNTRAMMGLDGSLLTTQPLPIP